MTGPPCIIGLEPRLLQRPIVLSLRQIIADIVVVLMVCERFGRGGWTEIDGTTWIVAVKGGVKGIGVVNRTLEDATDRSLGGVEAD